MSEIMSLIASFVPVWERSGNDFKFRPRHLLSCTLVSKFWRTVMLPHVWTVYSTEQMSKIPVDVLIKNSIYFQYFEMESFDTVEGFCPTPQELWQKDSLGQLLLQCSALKSFALTREALPEQLELLYSNRGVVSLDWWSFSAADLPGTISDTVAPFAASLRELGVRGLGGSKLAQDVMSLLVRFPKLERLRLGARYAPLLLHHGTGATGPCIRIDALKHLTIYENTWHDRFGALLSMLHYGPKLEHVVVNIHDSHMHKKDFESSYDNPVLNIQQAVLAWRSRDSDFRANSLFPLRGMVNDEGTSARLFHETHGPERLDIHIYYGISDGLHIHAEFQHGCQDLLEHLEFEDRSGLSKEESFAIFQGDFPEDPSRSTTTADTISTTTTGWACQHLKILAIRGLWRAYPYDYPGKNNVDIVLRAASADHQWVACGVVEFGNKLKEAISARLRILPALTELTLGTMKRFGYHDRVSIANFEYLKIDTASDVKMDQEIVVDTVDTVNNTQLKLPPICSWKRHQSLADKAGQEME
ncbi:hypothetical protein BG000_010277 [Podila horticola]|nr:hypothetical protein BG000_010277 [Podila horticola]